MADRRATFVQNYLPYAQQASAATGIDPGLILAQAAHETAWGRKAPGNNFFGIKGGGQTFATHEYVGGQKVSMKAGFRRYDSPADSFADWARLMQTPRYAGVLAATTPEDQARALKAAGYATDPNYVSKLVNVRNQVANVAGPLLFGQYDPLSGQLIQPGPMPGTLDELGQNPVITQLVKEQQQKLADAGLYTGAIDGIPGPQTKAAMLAYVSGESVGRIADVAGLVEPASMVTSYADPAASMAVSPVANIIQAREASQPTMATRAPPAPPPVMTPTPPPFTLEGTATAGQGNGATATGVLPPAVPTPRSRPLGGSPVAPPPTMASTPAPFKLEGSASTGQGSGASATGSLPPMVPTPRQRPDNEYFDVDAATMTDENGNYLSTGEVGGIPTPRARPSMAITPPPDPLTANKPVVQPLPPAPSPQPAPEPAKEPTPAGVSFISAASIPNLDASGLGSPNDSIVAAQSPIEAAVNGVGAASRLPEPPPEPVTAPVPVMEVSAPVQPPTNMATMRPPSPPIITTQAPPSMATSPAGGWFSKLFGGTSTNGGRGFTPTGGGVTPGGLAYRTGTGLGGQPGLQWTNSKGQTVTAVEAGFGQPGYVTGYS